MMSSRGGAYLEGKRLSLLTQHGKERVMAPLFEGLLGACLERAAGFDTDTFGTFTRDIARQGSQLEAARSKAKKGMELLGLDYGVASEGAFGPHASGLFAMNLELVVFIDGVQSLEIVGRAQGPAHHHHAAVTSPGELEAFAHKADFPRHGLVVRPCSSDPRVRKGLVDWPSLRAAFEAALAESQTSTVFVESDLRAHLNPTRMELIREATLDAIARIQSECPRCGMRGFGLVDRITGLPCRDCGVPTQEPYVERWACLSADHVELRDLTQGRLADPSRCDGCNP